MNLRAFKRDVAACAKSPWIKSYRVRAFRALMLERWNNTVPWKYEPRMEAGISRDGHKWRLPMRMWSEDFEAFRQIFLYGYYDSDLGQPRTILDLGGYCGFTSIAWSARFPDARIAAVEPHPENLEWLRANLQLNHLDKVAVFPAAATPADGPVNLFLGGGMTHGLTRNRYSTGEEITVEGLSVPSLLTRLAWDSIDLLKIDIEGAEALLFGGHQPWLERVQTIIGEYHGPYRIPELRRDLEPRQFKVEALPHPNLFIAKRLAN